MFILFPFFLIGNITFRALSAFGALLDIGLYPDRLPVGVVSRIVDRGELDSF